MNPGTKKKPHSRLPMIAQAGPVSLWMILFVTIPMLFIIFISFMTRGTFGGVEYTPTLTSYKTLADVIYLNVILKSLRVAVVTTAVCLLLGYPFAYYIARKPADVASRLIMLLMIPLWTNSLMRLNAWFCPCTRPLRNCRTPCWRLPQILGQSPRQPSCGSRCP